MLWWSTFSTALCTYSAKVWVLVLDGVMVVAASFLAALWFHFLFVLLQMNSGWVRNRFIFVNLHSKISWLFCRKCLFWSQFGLFLITFEVLFLTDMVLHLP
jgi:hypothetical protein